MRKRIGAEQQRLVYLKLGEQAAGYDLFPALEFPKDQSANDHQANVEVVPVKERHRRGSRRPRLLNEQTAASACRPERYVEEETQEGHARAYGKGKRFGPHEQQFCPRRLPERRHEPDDRNRSKRDQGA